MNRTLKSLISLVILTLWHVSAPGATNYWDIDGTIAGAGGATPSGTWDIGTTANWTTSSAGTSVGTTWTDGNDAIFSAGTDASGAFTAVLGGDLTAGNLTVEEGTVTIANDSGMYFGLNVGGEIASQGIINIASGLTARIDTPLLGGDDTGKITKTGTGTLVLSQNNYYGGDTIISAGVVAIEGAGALGFGATTIVSNGATLQLVGTLSMSEPVVLYGTGIANNGALRGGNGAFTATWSGGAQLGSDARIESGGQEIWKWTTSIVDGTVGGNNFNLIVGGNGGNIRFDIAVSPSQGIVLGTGTLTKEGTSQIQFEVPTRCSAFYFNGGSVYPRYDGGFGSGPIYVGAGAGEFRALFVSPNIGNPMSLAPGADPLFVCNQGNNWTQNGVISGLGGLCKTNPGGTSFTGTLFLNRNNTYFGNTTIRGGTLALGANGSISNSAVIDVWVGGTFDVSAIASGFVLGTGQTLKGNGTVLGNMTANGTIAPGASVGTLTNVGDLVLGGNLLIEVDKSLSPATPNDMISVTGALSHGGGGSVTVANLGPGLVVGDSFQIFTNAVVNGQTMTVTGAGAAWANNLAVDGSIAVVSVSPIAPATNLTIQAVGLTSRNLGGKGAANSAYNVYASTNVALPMTNWWLIGTTNSSAGGVIQFLDPQATNKQRFYRFGQ